MGRVLSIVLVTGYASAACAQPAEREVDGVHGECIPVYAAVADELRLYREPNLESVRLSIPYRAGWRIEAPKSEGMTRVLRIGTLEVIEPDERMHCEVEPEQGPRTLVEGETVQYLYYVGEGFGEIRFRGAECVAEVHEKLEHFRVIEAPEVQVWLRVFYADGTSPGWLLHDGTQTAVSEVLC